jgi:hypothetical protein
VKRRNIGSSFDSWLRAEAIYGKSSVAAIRRILARIDASLRRNHATALTRDFRDTIRARAACDREFREALHREGLDALILGDIASSKVDSSR